MKLHWVRARIFVAILLIGWVLAAAARAQGAPLRLFVATNGNDGWSGRLAAPAAEAQDGPLASLAGARERLRQWRSEPARQAAGAIVEIQGGRYRLAEPFVLEPKDSGSAGAPVVFTASEGARPVFSGGRSIRGWRRAGELWQVELPEVKAGWYFRQLWIDGRRAQRARSPNTGYHRVARLLPGPPRPNAKPLAPDRFVFADGDLQPWPDVADVNLVLMHSWENSIHSIRSVDPQERIVQFTAPLKEWWGLGYWEDHQRYFLENARAFLDQPGEWHLDRATGVLTYWPRPGERLETVDAIAPVLTEFVRMAGDPERGQFVEHVQLRGLTFHHADWVLDPKGNSSTQAAVEVPAVITADGARACAVDSCEVAHVGTYGLWWRRGCKDCRVQQTRLFDLGAGGVRVGEDRMARTDAGESSWIQIDNNHIYEGGRVYPGCVGIWVAQSSHNRIAHNDIHDLFYTGISVGWNWGLEPNRTSNNVIEFNHVHDLGQGVLSDAGLIYCLGVSPGSVIRNNVFHDVWPYTNPALGWGIYLDAQCGGYLVESNLVYNTYSGGLMFNNGGHAHVIRQNVFALSATHALWPYSERRPSAFRSNIVYLTQGDLLIPYGERSLNERLAAKESPGDWDANVYWHTGGPDALRFYRRTLAEWQALGLDVHSQIADPQFVDAAAHDFRLRPTSPALGRAPAPEHVASAGLYGDPAWRAEANHRRCSPRRLPPPPPPPAPLDVRDDFEQTPVGAPPAHAIVSGEEQGASIRVAADRAAGGRHSLKLIDAQGLRPEWQPHFYYEPHFRSGGVRQSFDAWWGTNAQFFVEWRDRSEYPHNVGPSVRLDGAGAVSVDGRVLTRVPVEGWVHVELTATVGPGAPRTFALTVTPAGEAPRTFSGLRISGKEFAEVHWIGVSSTATADTAVWFDNWRLERTGRGGGDPK